jgi:hypothetical protein
MNSVIQQDNFYFYTPDGQKFYSKIKGWSYAKKNNQPLFLYYYDHIWEKLNWKLEPTESLDYYYKAQAQRIRDEYDYVILCYSGGADSTNILETFHSNNIKLDKIVMVGALSQDSYSMVDENHNGELYRNCFPYLRDLGLESISEVIDYTKYFDNIKNFSIYNFGEEWIHEQNSFYSSHNWFWKDFEKYVVPSQYIDKKVAIIFGKDKPVLYSDNNGRYFKFRDMDVYHMQPIPIK